MDKIKIREALQQGYKHLGLSEEVFDRVAALGETTVTEETLANFIEGAKPMLQQFQSLSDKLSDTSRKLQGYEAKPTEEPPTPPMVDNSSMMEQFKSMLEGALTPIKQENESLKQTIEQLRTNQVSETTVQTVKTRFFETDGAKHYRTEADDAWDRAMEVYKLSGSAWSDTELEAKAIEYFNTYASRQGYDPAVGVISKADPEPTNLAKQYLQDRKSRMDTTADVKTAEDAYGLT